jgi:hypothetical protein
VCAHHALKHTLEEAWTGAVVIAEHYGFQLDDNPHDMAVLPRHLLAGALGSEAAAQLKAAQAAVHACGVPSWALLQVAWSIRGAT